VIIHGSRDLLSVLLLLLLESLLVLRKGAKVGATVWRQKNYTGDPKGANRVIEKLHTVNCKIAPKTPTGHIQQDSSMAATT
jgi:hypothetical protein